VDHVDRGRVELERMRTEEGHRFAGPVAAGPFDRLMSRIV
jgi:hypothetical protein